MKRLHHIIKRITSSFLSIHLVDRCLLLFMVVLLLQSTCTLFGAPVSSGEKHTIDIIVRTSISAIFGYFLSVNFIQAESKKEEKNEKTKLSALSLENTESSDATETSKETVPHVQTCKLQILVATAIGLFCLIVLVLVRDLFPSSFVDNSNSSFTATVSQFRDLISGCIGFLIGCPSAAKNKKASSE